MPVRILIIEDHADNLELMTYLLRAFGYETLTAEDGLSGLEIAARARPALIICDIQLPGLDGYEVAKRLKQDVELLEIPVVAITALAMVGDRQRVLLAGFDGYLTKPIVAETFVAEVEGFLKPEQQLRNSIEAIQAPDVSPPESEEREEAHPRASRGTILVVDNVKANRELARSIFEPSGYKVVETETADSAILAAKDAQPDLVLSDVNMPEATGFDLVARIKSDEQLKDIPVVLITATLPRHVSREEVVAVGAAMLIRRPLDPSLLLEQVEDCLQRARRATAPEST